MPMTPQAQESSTNPFVWQLYKDLLDDDYQFDVSHGLFMDSILHTQYDHYKWSIYVHVRSTLIIPVLVSSVSACTARSILLSRLRRDGSVHQGTTWQVLRYFRHSFFSTSGTDSLFMALSPMCSQVCSSILSRYGRQRVLNQCNSFLVVV
jgi:hypothetical protein